MEEERYVFPFKYLVFSGGGVRGCGYAKVWSVLEKYGISEQIKGVMGVSAGSILAALIALGFSGEEIEEIVLGMDYSEFTDNSWGFIRDTYRLLTRFGWNKGDVFLQWFGDLVERKHGSKDLTFKQAYRITGKRLVVLATCLETQSSRVMCVKTEPDMPIRLALRMSMSIPAFFTAVPYQGRTYVDGGVVNNYPIWHFDKFEINDPRHANETGKHCPTLGFRLIGQPMAEPPRRGLGSWLGKLWDWFVDAEPERISDIKGYMSALINTMCKTIENAAICQDYWERTVMIDTGEMGSIDFHPPEELVQRVVEAGETALADYLDAFMDEHPQVHGMYLEDFSKPGNPRKIVTLARTRTWPNILRAAEM